MKKKSILLHTLCALTLFSPTFFTPGSAGCSCPCEHSSADITIEEHIISKIAKSGGLIRIEDGSLWEVTSGYEKIAQQWRPQDTIIITPNPYYYPRSSYAMRNLTTGTLALVDLSLGPVINGNYVTRQIAEINTEQGLVLLSDGTSWLVSHKDTYALSKWEERDYIIIGVNNGSHYRNILINVTANRYVAAESY